MRKLHNLILLVIIALSADQLKAQVYTQDSLALVDLYNSTNGPGWHNHSGWLTSGPVSKWYGVTVTSNRVTSLYLYDNLLTGSIPSSLGNLTNLGGLDLDLNKLSGEIPASFNKLTKLTYLNLNDNHLTGSISFLAKLISPHDIELADNQLSGKIPVINCANLHDILLGYNQLNGSIPTFGKDTATDSDVAIDLDHNNLSGTINHQFDSVVHLAYLFLNNNQLTGRLPSSLNKLGDLGAVDVSYNRFSEKIPSLDSLKHIFSLVLQNNMFTFSGMEDLASHFPEAIYSPQANISITQNANVLSVSAGGTISNNTYKWYKNGVLFKTKTGNKNLTVNANANYSVAVTNSIATLLTLYSDTVSYAGLINSNASQIKNEINFSSAVIYPNPVKTTATISFTATGNCTIKLTDVSGNMLQTKTMIGIGANTLQLDVSKYAAGMYFVSVINEGKQFQTLQLNKE